MHYAEQLLEKYGFHRRLGYYSKRTIPNEFGMYRTIIVYIDQTGWQYNGPSQRDNGEPINGSYSMNGISELESLISPFGTK